MAICAVDSNRSWQFELKHVAKAVDHVLNMNFLPSTDDTGTAGLAWRY